MLGLSGSVPTAGSLDPHTPPFLTSPCPPGPGCQKSSHSQRSNYLSLSPPSSLPLLHPGLLTWAYQCRQGPWLSGLCTYWRHQLFYSSRTPSSGFSVASHWHSFSSSWFSLQYLKVPIHRHSTPSSHRFLLQQHLNTYIFAIPGPPITSLTWAPLVHLTVTPPTSQTLCVWKGLPPVSPCRPDKFNFPLCLPQHESSPVVPPQGSLKHLICFPAQFIKDLLCWMARELLKDRKCIFLIIASLAPAQCLANLSRRNILGRRKGKSSLEFRSHVGFG